jgi:predicted acylesterase/phospholipase RssA
MNPYTLQRPTIGLALSGASMRAVFYIGFLEVLSEYNITVDYIAASSSATIVAMAYACGTLPQLKDYALDLNKHDLFELLGKAKYSGTGLYSMDVMEELFRHFSRGLKFEEVRPLLTFVAVDIDRGEQVELSMGDLAKAARISCTLPVIFEPVEWGGNLLVDGGLLNIVPIDVVKKMNPGITVALNIRGTRHIFKPLQIRARKIFNSLKRLFMINRAQGLLRWTSNSLPFFADSGYFSVDLQVEQKSHRNILSILGRCLDLASEAQGKSYTYRMHSHTDFLVTPDIPKTSLANVDLTAYYYEAGRKEALTLVPKLQRAIKEYKTEAQKGKVETIYF